MTTLENSTSSSSEEELHYISIHAGDVPPVLIQIPKNQSILIHEILEQVKQKIQPALVGKFASLSELLVQPNAALGVNASLTYTPTETLQLCYLDKQLDSSKLLSEYNLPEPTPHSQVYVNASGSMSSSSAGTPVFRDALAYYINTKKCYDLINTFLVFINDAEATKKRFEPGMSVVERRLAHQFASMYNLHHQSEGKGEKRHMLIVKSTKQAEHKKQQSATSKKAPKASTSNENGTTTTPEESVNALGQKEKIPKGANEVIPGFLFLGSGLDANDHEFIAANSITYVLNATAEWPQNPRLPPTTAFKRIILKDTLSESTLLGALEETYSFIHMAREANEKDKETSRILVHCTIGKSRSASIVIAYLMKSNSWNLKQSLEYLQSKRPIVQPNDYFIKQLLQYEKQLFGEEYPSSLEWKFAALTEHLKKEAAQVQQQQQLEQLQSAINKFLFENPAGDFLSTWLQEFMKQNKPEEPATLYKKEWAGDVGSFLMKRILDNKKAELDAVFQALEAELKKQQEQDKEMEIVINSKRLIGTCSKAIREWFIGKCNSCQQ